MWKWFGEVFLGTAPSNELSVFTLGTPIFMPAFALDGNCEIQSHERAASPVEQPSSHSVVLGNGEKLPIISVNDRGPFVVSEP
jgi:hypothetical protein